MGVLFQKHMPQSTGTAKVGVAPSVIRPVYPLGGPCLHLRRLGIQIILTKKKPQSLAWALDSTLGWD